MIDDDIRNSEERQTRSAPAERFVSEDLDLDMLCEDWVRWTRTRRLYGPKPSLHGVLGRLSGTSTRPLKAGPPDAISSAELSAFHLAYLCQPDALDRRAFELYYVQRIKPVKVAAAALGVSRTHFYQLLGDFRKRVHEAAVRVLHTQTAGGDVLHKIDLASKIRLGS